ncbi:MAG: hypothetical protein SGILL_008605 [Bacillariaceae sp.]
MSVMKIDPEEGDSMLAQELTNLNVSTRAEIQQEIHGVESLAIAETPELIHRSLLQFQDAIDCFSGNKSAYEDAMTAGSSFVCSDELRIRFLRADFFDPLKAAIRFLSHLQNLMQWFGPVALLRPLQLSDLDRDAIEFLRAGNNQILPSRDRAGRLVEVCIIDERWFEQEVETRARVLMYTEAVIAEDVETQKNGLVLVICERVSPLRQPQMTRMEEHQLIIQLKKGLPVRWSAVHICVPEGPMHKIHRAFMLLGFGQDARVRSRLHPGFSLETQYKLLTFGINAVELPLTQSGTVKVKNQMQWIKIRRVVEEERKRGRRFMGVLVPRVDDVLFSKGGKNHHGNHEFKCIIESLLSQDRYQNMFSNRKDRRAVDHGQREAIRHDAILQVKARNGRFLILDEGGWWVELSVDSGELAEKIATSVYDHYKRLEARKKQKKSRSDTGDFLESSLRHTQLDSSGKSGDSRCGLRACMSS